MKRKLRKFALQERRNLSSEHVEKSSLKVSKNISLFISNTEKETGKIIKRVFLYSAFDNEIDVLKHLYKSDKKLELCLPCVDTDPSKRNMVFKKVSSLESLVADRYGILSPPECGQVEVPTEDTLILVPCVAANTFGYRVGYGAGFYDRYLSKNSKLIGKGMVAFVCYESQVSSDAFQDEWDKKADCIITDSSLRYVG